MSRYIDAEHIPNDNFFKDLTDTEKQKVLSWFIQAPTADVEKVEHGNWIMKNEFAGCINWQCSNCGKLFKLFKGSTPKDYNYDYCPNCGAKMNERKIRK